jgi:hypothetical protein
MFLTAVNRLTADNFFMTFFQTKLRSKRCLLHLQFSA